MWFFYPPVFIGIFAMALRYLGVRQLSTVNLGMPVGGLVDHNKAKNLLEIQHTHPGLVAKTALLDNKTAISMTVFEQEMCALELTYPVILKPNSGQRGLGVSIIRSTQEAKHYFENNLGDILLQEYIPGEEFGVFYMRDPAAQSGFIFSITHKQFPSLVGDGKRTLEQLILQDVRALYMAEYLLDLHADRLDWILDDNEAFQLVEIGSHCRGSLFVDGNEHITEALTSQIDSIGHAMTGYCFGRLDLRVPSIEAFQAGIGIKVLEANGLSSESANIYDPRHSVFFAYKTLFQQWNWAFKIGREHRKRGARVSSWSEIFETVKRINR